MIDRGQGWFWLERAAFSYRFHNTFDRSRCVNLPQSSTNPHIPRDTHHLLTLILVRHRHFGYTIDGLRGARDSKTTAHLLEDAGLKEW